MENVNIALYNKLKTEAEMMSTLTQNRGIRLHDLLNITENLLSDGLKQTDKCDDVTKKRLEDILLQAMTLTEVIKENINEDAFGAAENVCYYINNPTKAT